MIPAVNSFDSTKKTLSRRQVLTAGLGLAAMPLMSQHVFAAANDGFAKAPYRASTAEKKLNIISLDRLEVEARAAIPKEGYVFVSGGTGAQWTKEENRRAFNDYRIAPRRLVGVSNQAIDTRTRLLGLDLASPIIVAPMGAHGMVHEMAEKDTAKGAGLANTLYTSSGASNVTMEEIAQATTGPKWFQIYYNNDDAVNRNLLTRAKKAGYTAIVLTTDATGPGQNEDFIAMGNPFRKDMGYANHDPKKGGIGDFKNQKTNLTTQDIQFIKQFTGLPVIVKGVLRADDADRFIKAGADAIQVSNHGGRQIDGVPASISALPAIANAVNNRVPVIMDGGVRRGIDVVRALAMGADAVAVGRPVLYGLGMGGAQGVQSVLEFLNKDFRNAMLLSGAGKLSDLTPSLIKIVGENAELSRFQG